MQPYVYPGPQVGASFLQEGHRVTALLPHPDGGFAARPTLRPVDLSDRFPVISYGSNADPVKLHGRLDGPIVAIRAYVTGYAACWANGRRAEGSVVATFTEAPGRTSFCYVLMLTSRQRDRMDAWEGHGFRYERQLLAAEVVLEDQSVLPSCAAYIGISVERLPLLDDDGEPLWLSDYDHHQVDLLV